MSAIVYLRCRVYGCDDSSIRSVRHIVEKYEYNLANERIDDVYSDVTITTATKSNGRAMPEPLHAEADLVLVAELQRDARQTNRSLAKKAGLAPSTTLNRVRDLEQRGVLKGYHAHVDLAALGRSLQAMVFVRLQPKSDDVIDGFLDHMWGLPETIAVHLITGVEDAIIHLAVANAESLQRVIINEISSFPGVFDERTSLLFEHRRKDVITPL